MSWTPRGVLREHTIGIGLGVKLDTLQGVLSLHAIVHDSKVNNNIVRANLFYPSRQIADSVVCLALDLSYCMGGGAGVKKQPARVQRWLDSLPDFLSQGVIQMVDPEPDDQAMEPTNIEYDGRTQDVCRFLRFPASPRSDD